MNMQIGDMEELAGMSIEQIEEQAAASETKGGAEEGSDLQAKDSESEQAVESAPAGEISEEARGGSEGGFVETKNGKGKIPYKVLAETRESLAEANRKIEQLERRAYKASVPEDHQAQREGVAQEMAAIGQKFESGDLTWEEYQTQQAEVVQRREAILAAQIKADISTEMRQQQAVETWEGTVDHFLSSVPDGIDYRNDPERHEELDRYVKLFAADPSNNDKSQQWFLDTAHAAVKAVNGIVGTTKQNEPSKPMAKPPVADEDPTAGRPTFNTLSDIPGGTPPARDLAEQIGGMSGAALSNRFLNDPGSIDKYLASLGQ